MYEKQCQNALKSRYPDPVNMAFLIYRVRTYIFKKLNQYVNRIFVFVYIENPVCFLVCYVCNFDEKKLQFITMTRARFYTQQKYIFKF